MSLPDSVPLAVYVLAGIPVVLFIHSLFVQHGLRYIPTVGGTAIPVLSYISAFKFLKNGRALLQEGYDKYKGGMFKIPTPERWIVVVTGPKLIDELRRFPDEQVSFMDAAGESINTKYMFNHSLHENPYHIAVIKERLTRHLTEAFADIRDEIAAAFSEHIPAPDNGKWISVPALSVMQQVVARASNRIFVGLPYCRNKEYLQVAIDVTIDIMQSRRILIFMPAFLKPFFANWAANINRHVKSCDKYLHEVWDARLQNLERFGDDWPDKPNDMLQWLIDEERKNEKFDVKNLISMILTVNFAAIHTSSNTFTQALYHLAANPEFMGPLREEAEAILQVEGWTKAAMGKMRKLDSFMRESQRLNGISGTSVMRKTLTSIKFSNGAVIPPNSFIVAAATGTHLDEDNYENPEIFNPWRFSNMREAEGEALKHQFVSTSLDYVPFGHGKHACPGRFFAANELKAMMAHIVMNYDVKFEDEGVRPPNMWFGINVIPDPRAKVMFRKRQN
ncbi:hypothetical protein EIP86_003573 [Pleurotus ostreatoroseus]|nr:hypothetical protein EIP86_003573 [Pleurotus ostreatoroseus]